VPEATNEFRKFVAHLEEPIRTLALLCVSFGLRISEALALRWSDVNWLQGTVEISRGIVMQHVGDVKTTESARSMVIDAELLAVLKSWKQTSQFAGEDDWMFASPVKIGRLPISYPHVWQTFQDAARRAGLPQFGTHTLRHTYRSWLDAAGAPIAVQQKLMRHADILTTMNIYGDVVTDEMRQAHSKVVRMALRDLN
jgi:integrase